MRPERWFWRLKTCSGRRFEARKVVVAVENVSGRRFEGPLRLATREQAPDQSRDRLHRQGDVGELADDLIDGEGVDEVSPGPPASESIGQEHHPDLP